MSAPAPIPPVSFDAPPNPAGAERVRIELGGLGIALEGLDATLAAALTDRYGPYVTSAPAGDRAIGDLVLSLGADPRDYFIPPPDRPEINPVRLRLEGGRLRYLAHRIAGWFDTTAPEGRGALWLARGEFEPAARAIENFLRVCVAWRAVAAGGCLVHGASAVHRDRGYLFYGASGAGKSTLAACNRRATIVSDDLSLLLPRARRSAGESALDLVGSPFRGTYEGGRPFLGRRPLAAGFRLVQAPRARVEPVSRAVGFAGLVANLTFVVDALPSRPDVLPGLEKVFAGVPLAHLHFRQDESYWDAIEAAGL